MYLLYSTAGFVGEHAVCTLHIVQRFHAGMQIFSQSFEITFMRLKACRILDHGQ